MARVHVSLLTLFVFKFGNPSHNDFYDWIRVYLIIKILTWIKWTLTEAYYTYKKVELFTIGCVHVFLCLVVLAMTVMNYIEFDNKC